MPDGGQVAEITIDQTDGARSILGGAQDVAAGGRRPEFDIRMNFALAADVVAEAWTDEDNLHCWLSLSTCTARKPSWILSPTISTSRPGTMTRTTETGKSGEDSGTAITCSMP